MSNRERMTDTTGQPIGVWIQQDPTKPEFDALRYRGKLSVLLHISEHGKEAMRVVKCIRCVGSYFRRHHDVQIRRWLIVPS